MPFTTVYHSDFYKIEVDLKGNLLRACWLRHVTDDEIITGTTELYKALRDSKVERAVANGQELGAISLKAKDWLANEFYELLSQTNVKMFARVLPSNVFHQIALESVTTRAEALGKARFAFRNFRDQDEAEKWLLSNPVLSQTPQ
ncbi:hypothetical protein WG947_03315 [Pontibacter sp. H259]|uniref:hypothetical protein n=1 Tax=Pontibacter sp. H259 TaxID=3133421 RepID=UPI0030BEB74E